MDHVYYNNEKFYVKDGVLSILRKGVKSLSEIEGLEKLTNLKVLNLGWNEIKEFCYDHKIFNLVFFFIKS